MDISDEFRDTLEALCKKHGVYLCHEDSQGCAYLVRAAAGCLAIAIAPGVRDPEPKYVPPPESPELVEAMAKSEETWMQRGRRRGAQLQPSCPCGKDRDCCTPPVCQCGDSACDCPRAAFGVPAVTVPVVTRIDREPLQVLSRQSYQAGVEIGKLEGQALLDGQKIAQLERDAFAVRVLDCWAKKHGNSWAVDVHSDKVLCIGAHYLAELDSGEIDFEGKGSTPAEARYAAAEALLKEDPSLGESQ